MYHLQDQGSICVRVYWASVLAQVGHLHSWADPANGRLFA